MRQQLMGNASFLIPPGGNESVGDSGGGAHSKPAGRVEKATPYGNTLKPRSNRAGEKGVGEVAGRPQGRPFVQESSQKYDNKQGRSSNAQGAASSARCRGGQSASTQRHSGKGAARQRKLRRAQVTSRKRDDEATLTKRGYLSRRRAKGSGIDRGGVAANVAA